MHFEDNNKGQFAGALLTMNVTDIAIYLYLNF